MKCEQDILSCFSQNRQFFKQILLERNILQYFHLNDNLKATTFFESMKKVQVQKIKLKKSFTNLRLKEPGAPGFKSLSSIF